MTKQKNIKIIYPTDRHHDPITERQSIRKKWKWLARLFVKLANAKNMHNKTYTFYGRTIKIYILRTKTYKIYVYDIPRLNKRTKKYKKMKIVELVVNVKKKIVTLFTYKTMYVRKIILNAFASVYGVDVIKVKDKQIERQEKLIQDYINKGVIKQDQKLTKVTMEYINYFKQQKDINDYNLNRYIYSLKPLHRISNLPKLFKLNKQEREKIIFNQSEDTSN